MKEKLPKIKPCPFCDGQADVRICDSGGRLGAAVVKCPECDAHSRAFPCELFDNESIYAAQEKAINWWNNIYGGVQDNETD